MAVRDRTGRGIEQQWCPKRLSLKLRARLRARVMCACVREKEWSVRTEGGGDRGVSDEEGNEEPSPARILPSDSGAVQSQPVTIRMKAEWAEMLGIPFHSNTKIKSCKNKSFFWALIKNTHV